MAVQKKSALYSITAQVTQASPATYQQTTMVTNLALADRYGMSIKRVTFEHGSAGAYNQQLMLLSETHTNEAFIDDEDLIAKSSFVASLTTSGGWSVNLIRRIGFDPGVVIAQKELYFAIDSAEDVVARTGYVKIEYNLVKLTDSQLIALATK